ncbi:MAG: anti-sigma factor family protein [Nitriliruptoraceae bacterium]
MDDLDRLSSYLDGALDPDEQQALEAELAADRALRARLEALKQVDATLAAELAQELPEGARERLDERLGPVLRTVTTADAARTGAPTTSEALDQPDELAARRARRLPVAIGSVAAGLAILAAGVVGIDRLLPPLGGDEEASLAQDSAEERMELSEAAPEAAPETAPEADGSAPATLTEVPVVLDDGRELSEQELDLALAAAPLREVTAAQLTGADAAALAERTQTALLGIGDDADPAPEGGADAAAEEDAAGTAEGAPALSTPDGRLLDPADTADVRRCLAELLEVGTAAIPVQVELLTVDGVASVQVALVTEDPATGAYTRAEVWTLQRVSCQVLRFSQS